MSYSLSLLPRELKKLLVMVLFTLLVGMSVGLYYITLTSGTTPEKVVEHYNGNEGKDVDEFGISYGKSVKELTLTVHNHILSFTLIFFVLGIIFYGVKNISPKLKQFLLIEPFISIIITFGSMYLIRFIHPHFIFLMILSSSIMYLSFFFMIYYSFRELRLSNV